MADDELETVVTAAIAVAAAGSREGEREKQVLGSDEKRERKVEAEDDGKSIHLSLTGKTLHVF